ncbi:3-isopropylmalate dehydratase large subunit [Oscillospiraceae bacterium HV4-5-C5C]|nr:3-isopropylmalate dehydratase large subunit [Oscillospiraceae bacterium HV4-5-C5C]
MGMTMTQKILAAHAGLETVKAGDLIEAKLDLMLGNDVTVPPAIDVFYRTGATRVFDQDRIVMVPSHFAPNKDIKSAEHCKKMRLFAAAQGITHYYEQGSKGMGIEHVIVPENGLVLPGYCMIGADSHTCTDGALGAFATGVGSTDLGCAMATGQTWFKVPQAIRINLSGQLRPHVAGKDLILYVISKIGVDGALYRSMEYTGPGVAQLSMNDRLTICNMAIEAGGKNGIFPVDQVTLDYIREHAPQAYAQKNYQVFTADPDAEYVQTLDIDLAEVPLMVAKPYLPENGQDVRLVAAADQAAIQQVVIGSCTNGRYDDFKVAAELLRGRQVAPGVRCFIIPGSQAVYLRCLRDGLLADFVDAGCVVGPPTCGPCIGGHMGVLASEERCVSTTNRNFVGRMGSPESQTFLAGVPVACASAVMGRIASPDELPELVKA